MGEKITHEQIYDRLLDVTEEFAENGANTFDVANVMSQFVTKMAFDCAPCSQQATHLLLNAITTRIEHNHEEQENVN